MAVNNLKEFNNQWILFGFLFFSLMTFTIIFMADNNPDGLGSAGDKFDAYSSEVGGKLITVEGTSDTLLNVSAATNPEAGFLGSRDSVATSYGSYGAARNMIGSFKGLIAWMFVGTVGQMLVSVFFGMFALTGLYYIYKIIRQGS